MEEVREKAVSRDIHDVDQLFPEKPYLRAEDFMGNDGKYKEFTLEIESVKLRPMYDESERSNKDKPVIRFKKAKKFMILNVEIKKELVKIFRTKDIHLWSGRTVTAYVLLNRNVPKTVSPDGKQDVPRLKEHPNFPQGLPRQGSGASPAAREQGAAAAQGPREPGASASARENERESNVPSDEGLFPPDPDFSGAVAPANDDGDIPF